MDLNNHKSILLNELINSKSLFVSQERNVLILFTLNFTFFTIYKKLEKKKYYYLHLIVPILIILYYLDSIYSFYSNLINIDPNINVTNYMLIHILIFSLILLFSFMLYFMA